MDWGTALWDQHDTIEKHTQSGLDLIDRYVKFVKERVEIEQGYTKQLKALYRRHSRRGSKEDQEMRFSNQQSFQELLSGLNECATQRESMAENMSQNICMELTKYLHDVKLERKSYLNEVKKLQQNLEVSYKHLEASKKRFEKEWKEAEKAGLQAEKTEQDPTTTKADVEKARINARAHLDHSDECKNDYAAQLQKYNKEQNQVYHTEIPSIFNKLQQMEEKRIRKLAEGYSLLADNERNILPSISQRLEKIITHSNSMDEKQDSMMVIEQFKSGQMPPADVEFEDFSQGIRSASAAVENTHQISKVRIKQLFKKNKGVNIDRNMGVPPPLEDFSHLPTDQRKKRLQEKIDEVSKELQKETDQSEALNKMKRVYEQNRDLGDPNSLGPQINQTTQNINRLKGDLTRYQMWLTEAGGVSTQNSNQTSPYYLTITPEFPSPPDPTELQHHSSFDEDFDEDVPIARCLALYDFNGVRDGEVSMEAGEHLSVLDEDSGDGWVRVKKTSGNIGYVPASYIQLN
ncbi:thyroid hormone receptor interactor 10b isoform X2 [Tachysurus vachellii]|uniref:thyroid hormone receptor interactor 10b isoform X2 n=1 Tax=Tachysurus vachellii TaxID=175792 RepID=UPI00296AE488|nr:thyroid hormone receptor interactor 10b isoform X2 [Tachysurus vachellii]